MVGKADMGLFGWKQLVLWSLEHSCLSDSERSALVRDWEQKWQEFVDWVIKTYGTERSLI